MGYLLTSHLAPQRLTATAARAGRAPCSHACSTESAPPSWVNNNHLRIMLQPQFTLFSYCSTPGSIPADFNGGWKPCKSKNVFKKNKIIINNKITLQNQICDKLKYESRTCFIRFLNLKRMYSIRKLSKELWMVYDLRISLSTLQCWTDPNQQ